MKRRLSQEHGIRPEETRIPGKGPVTTCLGRGRPASRTPLFSTASLGFSHFSGPVTPHTGHRHNEVELVVFDRHPITVLYGGHEVTLPPGRLALFWGVMPHLPLRIMPGTEGIGLRLPLSWLLDWDLPSILLRRLLQLEVLTDDSPQDLGRMRDWVSLAASGDPTRRHIVLLEVQARLCRMALARAPRRARIIHRQSGEGLSSAFDRMARFIATSYTRDIGVTDVAEAGGITRLHAMRVFRSSIRLTIHKYITQQRVCHAQQMLATTQIALDEVARQSGFSSLTRFYASFKSVVGQSPAQYRRALRVNSTRP